MPLWAVKYMADSNKVLGQANPSANTLSLLYSVPAGAQTVVSSIFVCNRASSQALFRIAVAVNNASDSAEQYLFYDVPINGNTTYIATVGLTLNAGDRVRIYTNLANLSFSLFGIEIT